MIGLHIMVRRRENTKIKIFSIKSYLPNNIFKTALDVGLLAEHLLISSGCRIWGKRGHPDS
jgi:hypothetical protein